MIQSGSECAYVSVWVGAHCRVYLFHEGNDGLLVADAEIAHALDCHRAPRWLSLPRALR